MNTTRFMSLALAAVAVSAFSVSAGAQEWRGGYGGGPRCAGRITGYGKASLNPFSDRRHEENKARNRAISDWRAQASAAFGPRFSNWDFAGGRNVGCRGGGDAIECQATAAACRGGYGGPRPYRD